MDQDRFDALSRLFARTPTRRTLSAVLAGAVASFTATITSDYSTAEAKKKCLRTGTRCSASTGGKWDNCRRCCTSYSKPRRFRPGRRCVCKAEGATCTAHRECCSRRCTGGECGACPPGKELCQSGCVDLQTDDDNCGACGTACGAGQVCISGACTCTAGSCPDGCCAGDQCNPGTTDAFCGRNGETCASCDSGDICDQRTCVTGSGTCPAGANVCVTPGLDFPCNDNPGCFCIPTLAGDTTRCAIYYQTPQGFLRPCTSDAECIDLGPGAFCPPQYDSCGGVCSLPC